jgi:hypothetical protein
MPDARLARTRAAYQGVDVHGARCFQQSGDGSLWPTMACFRDHMPIDEAPPTHPITGDLSRRPDGSVWVYDEVDRWFLMHEPGTLPRHVRTDVT